MKKTEIFVFLITFSALMLERYSLESTICESSSTENDFRQHFQKSIIFLKYYLVVSVI